MSTKKSTRQHTIDEYEIWFTEPEHKYDILAEIAARVMNCPIAYFSVVSDDIWWIKAGHGVGQLSCPRNETVCNLVVELERAIVVTDVRDHPELEGHPALQGNEDLRAYVGVPIHGFGGTVIGTLCVFDTRPHTWGPDDIATMKGLASQLESLLELRRKVLNLAAARATQVSRDEITIATERQVQINNRVLHDFRNILAAIQANVDFLKLARSEQEANEVVEDVREACARGVEVVEELEDFVQSHHMLASKLVSDTDVEVIVQNPAAE